MRLLVSAGEASGEAYGAQLIRALRKCCPSAEFFGVGGEQMREAGCDTVVDARDVSVVGLSEVVAHLPTIYKGFRRLLQQTDVRRPDAAVLIDFPDFNFRVAKQLHRRGIPVFYYISPQLWAWRQGRIRLVEKYIREMLVIFPFEEKFYRGHGVEVQYVGHPLADLQKPSITREEFASRTGLDPARRWIALLPGSRRKEVSMNLPEMLAAAKLLGTNYDYVIPVASTLDADWLKGLVQPSGVPVRLTSDVRATLLHARAAVVASGTATVEAALMGTPFVMVYRLSGLTWALGRRLVKVSQFAMVNLIAGREVVPELVQNDFKAENIVEHLLRIIPGSSERETMICGMAEVAAKLAHSSDACRRTAAERAAEAILQKMQACTKDV